MEKHASPVAVVFKENASLFEHDSDHLGFDEQYQYSSNLLRELLSQLLFHLLRTQVAHKR